MNKYETELTQSKLEINRRMHEIVMQLKDIAEQVGTSRIEQAREYYDAQVLIEQVKHQLCEASGAYKAAASRCEVAMEMLHIAEQSFMERATSDASSAHLDYTYQEMLNHATETVVCAETERSKCDQKVRDLTVRTAEIEVKLNFLRRQHPRSIERAAVYFDFRARVDAEVKDRRRRCEELALRLRRAKTDYRRSLRRLDEISNEIHAQRVARTDGAADQQSVDSHKDLQSPTSHLEERQSTSMEANDSQNGTMDRQQRQSAAIETAVQSARNLVESASRRRLLSSASAVPHSPKSEADSQSIAARNVSDGANDVYELQKETRCDTDEMDGQACEQVEKPGEDNSAMPTTSESEQVLNGKAMASAFADGRTTPPTSDADANEALSESSSVSSLIIDVAFEKLVLGECTDRSRAPTTDSLSAASRSSSYERAIANTEQTQSLISDNAHAAEGELHAEAGLSTESEAVNASTTNWPNGAPPSLPSYDGDAFMKQGADTASCNMNQDASSQSGAVQGSDSESESDFETVETTV